MDTTNTNYRIRFDALCTIYEMSENEFLWNLLCDTLPKFPLAVRGDPDFEEFDENKIYRETNHEGLEYTYRNIHKLCNYSREDFMRNFLFRGQALTDAEWEKMLRDLVISTIANMDPDEFCNKIERGELPQFKRAEKGDIDWVPLYRSPNVNSTNGFYKSYIHTLRTVEWDEYIKTGKIFAN